MAKKLQRVFRDRHLTSDEAASDKELREKLQREFPPKNATTAVRADSLSELLRRSIRESGRSIEEIASDAGIPPTLIARFVAGQRDIHMATADRLARSLRLEVTAE